jgi:hypothetical protein
MWGGDIRVGWDVALAALVLSFVLSASLAWIYRATYQGTLVPAGLCADSWRWAGRWRPSPMLAIGDDIARGLGLVGALTLIRFRSTLKDTRDLVFAFGSLAVGVACGVTSFGVAVLGALVISGACPAHLLDRDSAAAARSTPSCACGPPMTTPPRPHSVGCSAVHCRGYTMVNMRDIGGSLRSSRIRSVWQTAARAAPCCATCPA